MKKILSAAAAVSFTLTSCGVNSVETTNMQDSASALKDGAYTQHYSYSPSKDYTFFIDVNAEIKDGTISSMTVQGDPNGQMTLMFADEFKNSFQDKVIGKTIEEAKELVYVSGASLTSKAFKEALGELSQQATQ